MNLSDLKIDKTWTLFLDRDGVINRKLDNDYVKRVEEFEFLPGAIDALVAFRKQFGRILIVTNQQGIGKGLMSHEDLEKVHAHLLAEVRAAGGDIDRVYYCPNLASDDAACRKPNTGMAVQARKDFPEINFEKSIVVGDSLSDIQMGVRAGMYTVFVSNDTKPPEADCLVQSLRALKAAI